MQGCQALQMIISVTEERFGKSSKPEAIILTRPPRYITPDWESAWQSVKELEALNPSIAVTGHGLPMAGEDLTNNLKN